MRVYLSKVVTRQLNAIFAHVAADNPSAAQRIVLRFEEVRKLLGGNLYIGCKLPHSDLRWFPLAPFPYIVYYAVAGGSVRIVRIWHASRRRAELHDPAQAFATECV